MVILLSINVLCAALFVSSKLVSGMVLMVQASKAKNIPEPYYEIRPGGVAIVFRFEDINNESNSNQNCELDCESIRSRVKECPLTHFLALKFACT